MDLQVLTLSSRGGRKVNEDAYGVWSTDRACYCVVSDGVGGHGGGDTASRLVVQHALEWFRQHPASAVAEEAVRHALEQANEVVLSEQRREERLNHMQATAVLLAVDTEQRRACWGHLGDSRLYYFHQRQLVTRTRDHSVIQRMVDAGYLPASELRTAPERSRLLVAIGASEHIEPDTAGTAEPILPGDTFLLCSDGLWEYLDEDEIVAILTSHVGRDSLQSLESLVRSRGRAGQDNYTAVLVWCEH